MRSWICNAHKPIYTGIEKEEESLSTLQSFHSTNKQANIHLNHRRLCFYVIFGPRFHANANRIRRLSRWLAPPSLVSRTLIWLNYTIVDSMNFQYNYVENDRNSRAYLTSNQLHFLFIETLLAHKSELTGIFSTHCENKVQKLKEKRRRRRRNM